MKNDIIRDTFEAKKTEIEMQLKQINNGYISTIINFMKDFTTSTGELYRHEMHEVEHHHLGDHCSVDTFMSTDKFEMKIQPSENSKNMFNNGYFDESYVREVLEGYGVEFSLTWNESHSNAKAVFTYVHNTKKNEKRR